jgi:hypothetical protein
MHRITNPDLEILEAAVELLDVEEIDQARITLRRHLAESFRELFESHQFREALSGHLPPDWANQSRVPTIFSRIKQIAEL